MQPSHPDCPIWVDLYQEEYKGLTSKYTFNIISAEEYHTICSTTAKTAIPSMGILSVKKEAAGHPTRVKNQIIVLGNKDPTTWTKADWYTPIVALPIIHLLTALAIQHCTTLKWGDCKNTFIQSKLPDNEITIICPPSNCPTLAPNSYWHLWKSLYGLR